MRLRILVGMMILILGLCLYALGVVALAAFIPSEWAAEALFYAVAGVLWIFPAARLTRWMQQVGSFRPPLLE